MRRASKTQMKSISQLKTRKYRHWNIRFCRPFTIISNTQVCKPQSHFYEFYFLWVEERDIIQIITITQIFQDADFCLSYLLLQPLCELGPLIWNSASLKARKKSYCLTMWLLSESKRGSESDGEITSMQITLSLNNLSREKRAWRSEF